MTPSEYNRCVRELADRLYYFALKSLKEEEEAKDVVQQAFLTLWEKRKTVKNESAKNFLFTVAYRRCMDFHRQKNDFLKLEEAENSLMTEEPVSPDLSKILEKALATLKPQHRTLVLLKDYEGYSYEEISNLTGLSPSQVKVYLHRARKDLRTYLKSKDNLI